MLDRPVITTERLILRPWRDSDLAPFAEINADPQVREFFPSVLTREESDATVRYFQDRYDTDGFCMFAAELSDTGELAGSIGLLSMNFAIPNLAPAAVEIGWRLARHHWGKGLATEGAHAALRHGFETLRLHHVVAITVAANMRSRRVMEKIGMRQIEELSFDHPRLAEGHLLRRHVLYAVMNHAPAAAK